MPLVEVQLRRAGDELKGVRARVSSCYTTTTSVSCIRLLHCFQPAGGMLAAGQGCAALAGARFGRQPITSSRRQWALVPHKQQSLLVPAGWMLS